MTTNVECQDAASSKTPISLPSIELPNLERTLSEHSDDSSSSRPYLNHSSDEKNHAEKMLKEMYKCYEEGKFCDVTFVVGANEIKAHRLVLCSLSEYFNSKFVGCWKDSYERIEIEESDEETLKCILHFAYTGKLKLSPSNVLNVLAVSDYLRLVEFNFVKESVGDYLKEKVNKDNCAEMLSIAEQFSIEQLKEFLVKFVARNFFQLSQSEDFLKLSDALFSTILESKVLIVDLGRDFLPPNMEQEDFILDVVLKYVSKQQSDSLLAKHIKNHIRVCCLSPSSLEKLYQFALDASLKESLKLIMQAKEENASESEHMKLWKTEREGAISKEIVGKKVHGYRVNVGPIQLKFGDEFHGPDLFIRGMKIWIRLWDNHPVLGGLQVFYSNGKSPIYGAVDLDEVYEFHLVDDERIIKAKVQSGWMVDSLMFFTNKGQELGPYGGGGGSKKTEKPRGKYSFLSRLTGVVVKTQGKLAVINLRLIWRKFMIESDPDAVESNGSSDFSDSSDNE